MHTALNMSSTETFVPLVNYEWCIKDFHLCEQKTGERIVSPTINVPGQNVSWYLRLYPNGENDESKDCIGLYLKLKTSDEVVKVKVTFTVFLDKNEIASRVCNVSFTPKVTLENSIAPNAVRRVSDEWGYAAFLKRSSLKFKNTPKGKKKTKLNTLKICCKIEQTTKSQLLIDLNDMIENGTFSDIEVVVGGQVFKTHKAILALRSPVFKAMLELDIAEKNNNIIIIEDIKPDVFKELLTYIYTERVPNMSAMAPDLFFAADKYDLAKLKEMCVFEMTNTLHVDNVCDRLILADLHNCQDLKDKAMAFVLLKSNEVKDLPEWKTIAKNNPDLMLYVVILCVLTSQHDVLYVVILCVLTTQHDVLYVVILCVLTTQHDVLYVVILCVFTTKHDVLYVVCPGTRFLVAKLQLSCLSIFILLHLSHLNYKN